MTVTWIILGWLGSINMVTCYPLHLTWTWQLPRRLFYCKTIVLEVAKMYFKSKIFWSFSTLWNVEVEAHVQCHDDILWNIFLSETLRSHHWTQDQFQLSLSKAQIFWTLLIRISAAAWKRLHSKLNWTIDVCINMYIYDKDFIIRHLMRLLLSSFEFYMSELEFYVHISYV